MPNSTKQDHTEPKPGVDKWFVCPDPYTKI